MESIDRKLKRLHVEGISEALEKAHRYRLLNEPLEAESICLDVLEVDPQNQRALITLILALTDHFNRRLHPSYQRAMQYLGKLSDEYSRCYYEGLIYERRGKVSLHRGQPSSGHMAYGWFEKALKCFEVASELSPEDNPDADLRWNTILRILERYPEIRPAPVDSSEPYLE